MFRPGHRKRPRPLRQHDSNVETGGTAQVDGSAEKAKVSPAFFQSAHSSKVQKGFCPATQSHSNSVPKNGTDNALQYFAVLYAKRSSKKKKSFQDGYISIQNDRVLVLTDDKGKRLSKSSSSKPMGGLKEGNTVEMGTFEVEIDLPVDPEDFTSGRIFLSPSLRDGPSSSRQDTSGFASATKWRASNASHRKFVPPATRHKLSHGHVSRVRRPAHDPNSEGAVVLQDPFPIGGDTKNLSVPILIDPCLSRHMRPHQKDGVKFLYNCVEGANKSGRDLRGAILADSMGLGKSLQAIALLWTLLKQGPTGRPTIEKGIIVCPASLVGNWGAELKKWLSDLRLQWLEMTPGQAKSYGAHAQINDFIRGSLKRVLVVSYEMFRTYAGDLYDSRCGLIICDEGHRLKSSQGNKTIDALMGIPCRRRIILTGTPIQNDLEEYFAMCNFVNPTSLGTLSVFRTVFATPILDSRDANATPEVARLGSARAEELNRITSRFVLRRTAQTLENYLPRRTEIVLFCRLTPEQETHYEKECCEGQTSLRTSTKMGAAFSTIAKLRKICCHPDLLESSGDRPKLPMENAQLRPSGKLEVAMSLCSLSAAIGDRLVVVSNFTSALDVLGRRLLENGMHFLRLDGSTPVKDRMALVDCFNSGRTGESVFLLSAKAGGVGLNLIGANRLILFDPDWNPATDMQTMGRVWRDGQSKDVFVYRLMGTGTIEEKIYQRQIFKGALQHAVDGPQSRSAETCTRFSAEELKDLFGYNADIKLCETLEALERSLPESVGDSEKLTLLTKTRSRFSASQAPGSDYVRAQVLQGSGKDVVSCVYCPESTLTDTDNPAEDDLPAGLEIARDIQAKYVPVGEDQLDQSNVPESGDNGVRQDALLHLAHGCSPKRKSSIDMGEIFGEGDKYCPRHMETPIEYPTGYEKGGQRSQNGVKAQTRSAHSGQLSSTFPKPNSPSDSTNRHPTGSPQQRDKGSSIENVFLATWDDDLDELIEL